ncbi:MAG: hypothetical protein KAH84_04015 [Thiomargarita sp.]|nr:hypothetical protein [Thiomargarita sp.]
MAKLNYSNHKNHQIQHLTFINKLEGIKQESKEMKDERLYLILKVEHELTDWLIQHYNYCDKQFEIFLEENSSLKVLGFTQ